MMQVKSENKKSNGRRNTERESPTCYH